MSDLTSISAGPLFAAGLLFLGAFGSLFAQCHCHGDPTADEDWDAAAEKAVDIAEPSDAIRIHPTWSDAPLPALQPVGNLLHRHQRPLLEDLVGVERLLIITERSRRDGALARLPFSASPDEIYPFETIELLEVSVPEPLRLLADLTPALADAQVAVVDADGQRDACHHSPTEAGVFRCDRRGDDQTVRSTLKEIEDDPRRCIRARPPSGDRHLAVEIPVQHTLDVLRIRAGLDNRAARLFSGDDVIYRLFVDDAPVADERVDGHTSTWTAHDVSTAEFDGGPVDVRLEIESIADNPHHRRFCFNAWPMTDEQAR